MNFLVDAQLPRRLAEWLRERGHDACHTLDLAKGNRTSDAELCMLAANEDRIVVTKDDDFVQGFMVNGMPPRLLLVATGNIANAELLALWRRHIDTIEAAFHSARFVELGRAALIIHA